MSGRDGGRFDEIHDFLRRRERFSSHGYRGPASPFGTPPQNIGALAVRGGAWNRSCAFECYCVAFRSWSQQGSLRHQARPRQIGREHRPSGKRGHNQSSQSQGRADIWVPKVRPCLSVSTELEPDDRRVDPRADRGARVGMGAALARSRRGHSVVCASRPSEPSNDSASARCSRGTCKGNSAATGCAHDPASHFDDASAAVRGEGARRRAHAGRHCGSGTCRDAVDHQPQNSAGAERASRPGRAGTAYSYRLRTQ